MIKNQSPDNPFARGIEIALSVAAITVIYFAALFRKDAYLILGITFALYGLLMLARRLCAGVSENAVDRLEKIIFYLFVVSAIFLIVYALWTGIIPVQIFG